MKVFNKKGSTLLWAVCAISVLAILVAGILTFSMSFYKTDLSEVSKKQAEYNARSAIEILADQIIENDDKDWLPAVRGERISAFVDLEGNEIEVVVERTSQVQLTLIATGKSADEAVVVRAILQKPAVGNWYFSGFTGG